MEGHGYITNPWNPGKEEYGSINQNKLESARCYINAASCSHPQAMYHLAKLYATGEGVHKDLRIAFECYQKAADLGVTEAIFDLAHCYTEGLGTVQSLKKAMDYLSPLAEQGNAEAQYRAGCCYMMMNNEEEAFRYFILSAANRHSKGTESFLNVEPKIKEMMAKRTFFKNEGPSQSDCFENNNFFSKKASSSNFEESRKTMATETLSQNNQSNPSSML